MFDISSMSTDIPFVLVGVATYRRNRMLDQCLASLAAQRPRPGWQGGVLVVDNDGGARDVVGSWTDRFALPLRYDLEAERGISQVRNRVIAHALDIDADYIAFIDDDETASGDWLYHLTEAIQATGAHAVTGPVQSQLQDCPQSWRLDKPVPSLDESQPLPILYTNNVIFSTVLVKEWGLRFDPNYALTGGEDLDFFLHARCLGALFRASNRALVHETVPCDRQTLAWQLRRVFRTSACQAEIESKYLGHKVLLRYLGKGSYRLAGGLLRLPLLPFTRLGGTRKWRRAAFKVLSAIASGLGMLAGLVNFNIEMYR